MATSSGKTVAAALLARTISEGLGGRLLFIADREELIQQPLEKFAAAVGIIPAVERGGDRASLESSVVVTSVQTMSRPNRMERFARNHFTHIIDDEAHRNTDLRVKIHEYFETAKVLGMTATPFRKNEDLAQWYNTVAFSLGTFDLVDQGYITPPMVVTAALEIDLKKVRQTAGDFDQNQVASIMAPLYPQIAQKIREHAANRTILAFTPLIVSSKEFVEAMKHEGFTAMHCDGAHPDRKGILAAFERGDFQILSNSQVFSTGVDFIRCDCLLNLAPTRSRTEFRQRAGRIMRLLPGTIDPGGITLPTAEERKAAIAASAKPNCLILDLLWQTAKIGLAGPGSLMDLTEEDEKEVAERIKKQRTPEEIMEVCAAVQRDREKKLRQALEEAARQAAAAGIRAASLIDARQLVLELQDRSLMNWEAASPWEAGPATAKQRQMIEGFGVNADDMEKGRAQKILDAVLGRQKAGKAPYESFAALRAAGIEDPSKLSLDDAIRELRDGFPMTFGKKYRGVPLREVPKSYWGWLMYDQEPAGRASRKVVQERHPAVWRFLTKIVFPPKPQPETQPELALQ